MGADRELPIVVVKVEQRPSSVRTRVGDHHVDPAEAIYRGGHEVLRGRPRAHRLGADGRRPTGRRDFVDHRLGWLPVSVVHDELGAFGSHGQGVGPSEAAAQALGLIYQTLQGQSAILAYTDVFRIMGGISLAAIPFMFLLKKVKGSRGAGAMH